MIGTLLRRDLGLLLPGGRGGGGVLPLDTVTDSLLLLVLPRPSVTVSVTL